MRKSKVPRSVRVRLSKVKGNYGLSEEQYAALVASNENLCFICYKPCSSGRLLAVDHDHVSGKVRGLLCNMCNRGIGHFRDSPDLLMSASVYLKNFERNIQLGRDTSWYLNPDNSGWLM